MYNIELIEKKHHTNADEQQSVAKLAPSFSTHGHPLAFQFYIFLKYSVQHIAMNGLAAVE